MYNIVGHMTIVSSSVLIHTLLFGNEDQVGPAKARLEFNFKILMKLKDWWPSVAITMTKLFYFQQACLDSANERTHKVDRWMNRFLLEHGHMIVRKDDLSGQSTLSQGAADLDTAPWLSARNQVTREALSHLREY